MAAELHALLEHNNCLLMYLLMEGRREERKEGKEKRRKDYLF